jgi:hypothetical protein
MWLLAWGQHVDGIGIGIESGGCWRKHGGYPSHGWYPHQKHKQV